MAEPDVSGEGWEVEDLELPELESAEKGAEAVAPADESQQIKVTVLCQSLKMLWFPDRCLPSSFVRACDGRPGHAYKLILLMVCTYSASKHSSGTSGIKHYTGIMGMLMHSMHALHSCTWSQNLSQACKS